MDELEKNRKSLNKRQTELRRVLTSFKEHDRAIEMFLRQHAMLHAAEMAGTGAWSFEDAILADMSEDQIRCIPRNCEHSVAWLFWHMARIEDTAMNLLVAGDTQVLNQGNWLEQMKVNFRDTGNEMVQGDMAELSAAIDIPALRAYRVAVGRRTQQIVKRLAPEDLKARVDPARLQRVMEEGALVEAASGIRDYWSKRTIAGLLLMPPTRHNLVHLNEALRLKKRKQ